MEEKPAILIGWGHAAKGLKLAVDFDQIKTWEFAVAVLDMAAIEIDTDCATFRGDGPAVLIGWDDEEQKVRVIYDEEQLKNPVMAEGVIQMALELAKFNANLHRMAQVQHSQMEAKQAQDIRSKIMRGMG